MDKATCTCVQIHKVACRHGHGLVSEGQRSFVAREGGGRQMSRNRVDAPEILTHRTVLPSLRTKKPSSFLTFGNTIGWSMLAQACFLIPAACWHNLEVHKGSLTNMLVAKQTVGDRPHVRRKYSYLFCQANSTARNCIMTLARQKR